MPEVPAEAFEIQAGHIILTKTYINDEYVPAIFDSGIGINLITKQYAEELHLKPHSTFTGKRMSGQEIQIPICKVDRLKFCSVEFFDQLVGIFDTSGFPESLKDVKVILSIHMAETLPLEINYKDCLIRHITPTSRITFDDYQRQSLRRKEQNEALDIHTDLLLPNGEKIDVEIDTGCDSLILNKGFMEILDIEEVKMKTGKDETSHGFERFFTQLNGAVRLSQQTGTGQIKPRVMFQDIIYDGLIGHQFLSQFESVIFNLKSGQMFYR